MYKTVYNTGEISVINGLRCRFNNGEISERKLMVTREWVILSEHLGIDLDTGDVALFPCKGTESRCVGNIRNYNGILRGIGLRVFIEAYFLGGVDAHMIVCDCLENTGSLLARSLREVSANFKRDMRELLGVLDSPVGSKTRYRGEFLKRVFKDMWVLTLRYPDRYKDKFLTVVRNQVKVEDGRSSYIDRISKTLNEELEKKKILDVKKIMDSSILGIPSYEYISRVNDNMQRLIRMLK